MSCGVVIINYRDAKRAEEVSIRCSGFHAVDHVVITDNCSPDESMLRLKQIRSNKIDVIQSDRNGGFSYGCNFGASYLIRRYNPTYILFANTDTIFGEDVVDACLSTLSVHDDLGMVTPRMQGINGEEQISAWPFTTFKDQLLNCFWAYRHYLALHPHKHRQYSDPHFEYVDVARGSFMFFKTEALVKAGFFDEHTFLYAEETIMAKRLLAAGYKIGIITDKWYIHDHKEAKQKGASVKQLAALFDSSYYYLNEYCHINLFQRIVFSIAKKYGVAEWAILSKLKEVRNKRI